MAGSPLPPPLSSKPDLDTQWPPPLLSSTLENPTQKTAQKCPFIRALLQGEGGERGGRKCQRVTEAFLWLRVKRGPIGPTGGEGGRVIQDHEK